ncbi:MAG: response regulator [Haloarculaceae archaeon]
MSDIRVLVVDENPDVVELTKTFLEREDSDLDVRTEQRPHEVIERIPAEDVDCVVSDFRMPGLDGLELYDRIREPDQVPFFLFTAAQEEEVRESRDSLDVDGIVQKGTGTDHYAELAQRIRTAVQAKGA